MPDINEAAIVSSRSPGDMAAEGRNSTAQIDDLISRFFAVFDNRDGRIPQSDGAIAMFADRAVIAKHVGDRCELYSPMEFLSPRIELLTSGELTGFHEWEVSAKTVYGSLNFRVARNGQTEVK